MAIDTTLIKGAAQANKAREPVAAMAIAGTAEAVGETLVKAGEVRGEREEDFNKVITGLSKGMTKGQYDMLNATTKEDREVFIKGNRKERGEVGLKLARMGDTVAQALEFHEGLTDRNFTNAWYTGDEGVAVQGALKSMSIDEDGEVVYGTGDNKYTLEEMQKLFSSHEVDEAGVNAIKDIRLEVIEAAKNNPEDPFDEDSARIRAQAIVSGSSNIGSWLSDIGVGDASFADHLRKGLAGIPYANLGIDFSDGKSSKIDNPKDPGSPGGAVVTEGEAGKIIEALMDENNASIASEAVVDWITMFLQRDHTKTTRKHHFNPDAWNSNVTGTPISFQTANTTKRTWN